MSRKLIAVCIAWTAGTFSLALPVGAWAETELEVLKRQVEELQRQLAAVQAQLEQQMQQAASKEEVKALKKEVKQAAKASTEWKEAESVVHLAGYGTVGYTDTESGDGTFDVLTFNPIFHYQYKDLFLLEAELEMEVNDMGETELALEYGTIDWLANDYATLVAGKFLSPVGQFRQNLHPGWINKFASAPPGFGHDGAAPISDIGVQVRGGVPIGNAMGLNYAAYVGNGPRVMLEGDEVHGVEAEGFAGDEDGEKVWGGRVGFLPIPALEIGLSGAFGDVGPEGEEALTRDYRVYGADAAYRLGKNLDLRSEYVKTEVGSNALSAAPESATWETWYAQAAYRFLPTKWEAVIRYGEFDSPHAEDDQEQLGIGVNYWFAPNAVAKLGYEINDGASGTSADDNRTLLQMSYGF